MKLINWSKISQMLAPEAKEYNSHCLVIGKKEDSSAQIRSNYDYLKENLSEAIEVKNGSASYLLIDQKSAQVSQAENYLTRIKEEEFLDEKRFKEELSLDNLHHHKQDISCGLCGKPLSANRSTVSHLGPICEHKVNEIVKDQAQEPQEFKSIYSESLVQGELLWFKINNQLEFVEIIDSNSDEVSFINHKDLAKEIETNSNYTQVLKENLFTLNKKDISGVARVVAKKNEEKPLFDDLMEIFK